MKITFLGTGVAIPQAGRVQSGLIIDAGSKPLLVDCGSGVLNRIFESRHQHTDVDTILLSHLHLDHVADVLPLIKANWLCDRTDVTIYGPEGTYQWITKLLDIYPYMQCKVDINVIEMSAGDTVTPEGTGCKITAAEGVHSVPSLGFRIGSGDSTVVYSGDTEPCTPIMNLGSGADVLIHECSFPAGFDVTNHTTPHSLAGFLDGGATGIKKLYLTHLYPQMQGHEQESVEMIKQHFAGHVQIASDMLEIEV